MTWRRFLSGAFATRNPKYSSQRGESQRGRSADGIRHRRLRRWDGFRGRGRFNECGGRSRFGQRGQHRLRGIQPRGRWKRRSSQAQVDETVPVHLNCPVNRITDLRQQVASLLSIWIDFQRGLEVRQDQRQNPLGIGFPRPIEFKIIF